MLQKFKQHLHQNFPFLEDKKLLIAISGGIDSVVLAHLCSQLNLNFSLCHCNFNLRGQESDDDEAFVKSLAKTLKTPVYSTSFETEKYVAKNKVSIQVAARDLRYTWFYKLLDTNGYDYVLTAHNTNDNLETFIINLTRGSGLEGFTGIPPVNQKSVRPLLAFSRDEITLFAIKNGIIWREDKSNASIKYVRNKVRHKVIPILKELNPHVLESFQNTIEYLNESQSIINDALTNVTANVVSYENDLLKISCKEIEKLSNKKAYLYQLLQGYGFTAWNDIVNLISAQPGKQVFSDTHRLLKDRNFLILTTINKNQSIKGPVLIDQKVSKITNPIKLTIQNTDDFTCKNTHEIIIDNDLINYPLSLKKWHHGDTMYPAGMKGSKKISQLFKDNKLSLLDKEKIWILADAKNHIIWVIGLRQDRRYLANITSKNRLKISYLS
ncbi:tRNA lysidine(34) synthetase TilS [Flavobacteriaceae bacterium]|jgi:tRNA(Ile)-lysidine synthase|nr:tRNA lysidine(34) synthetase TilS [Flavobacteriaceae bacterium]MDB2336698.1 tRNA lysidine(34) synthetase TilS [Flavobacteriaceae bacterium]MDB2624934.1 tRNA lysidine(34) synthetase TilS [Flavobacteriaceae bacterium]MDB2661068.1 tRNA lysidine(34) synthetase TilS [Flavobacteriaceae bacterium]|tara:strand:+ start:17982 stop:19298 length:1317 start_codon:yes stop_codon:yes gene_type:complete